MNIKKIVIADDNDQFREMLEEYLNLHEDLQVSASASNGNEAIDLIKEHRPDIVILDIIMPYLDGLGVLEEIRKLNFKKKPIILVLSAVGQTKITEKAIELGATYYIMKPFDMKVLVERIRYLLSSDPEQLIRNSNNIEKYGVKEIPKERTLENEITRLLCKLGIPANLKGYKYIRQAVVISARNNNVWNTTTKELYKELAEQFSSTPMGVERAIRHAIESGLDRGNINAVEDVFGYTIDETRGKPTNKEFITMLVDKMRIEQPDLI